MTSRPSAPRKINCMQVGRKLQSYLDGEIDDLTARRIAAHLTDCRRCGLEAAAYTELKRSLARRAGALQAEPINRLRDFSRRLAAGELGPDGEAENSAGA
jgi:anti-sigma factor RsiW